MIVGRLVIVSLLVTISVWNLHPGRVEAQESVVTVAMSDAGWPPIFQIDKELDRVEGLWPDLLELLFEKKLNLTVKYVLRPWQRAQNMVRYGEADILLTISTETRKEFTYVTDLPIYQMFFRMYTYADHPRKDEIKKIRTVEDIKNLELACVSNAGNGWVKEHVESKGVKTFWVQDDSKIARFLASRRADVAIDIPETFNPIIKESGLSGDLVQTAVAFGPVDFYILVGKESPLSRRLPEINKALRELTEDGSLKELMIKYQ